MFQDAARMGHALGFAALVAAGAAVVHFEPLQPADHAALDLGFRILRETSPQPVERDVVLVGIDEATYRALPEPFALWHPHLARFLQAMAAARPSVVGLDVVLPERSYDFLLPGYDRPLLEALLAARRVAPLVLAVSPDEFGQPRRLFPPFVSAAGAGALGSAAVCREADLAIRRYDPLCGGSGQPESFAGRMARHLGAPEGSSGYLDYAVGGSLGYVPLQQVLAWHDRGETARLQSAFGGRPVILGSVVPYVDRHPLPVPLAAFEPNNRVLPGALVHAQALRSMLHRGFVQPMPALAVLLASLAVLAFWWFPTGPWKILIAAAAAALVLAGSLFLLWKGYFVPSATLAGLLAAALLSRAMLDAWLHRSERRMLRQAFASYVSPRVLSSLLSGRLDPGMAGERRPICAMACFFPGFAERALQMPPEQAISTLDEVLSAAGSAVRHHGGSVYRTLGDGVLALFSAPAPLETPEKNALEAAQTLLESVEALKRRGLSLPEAAIGLHWGEAVLGQVGRESRMEYAAVGDVIEIAVRLHEVAAQSGYPVVCSVPVADAVGRAGGLQDLGMRSLPGLEPLQVFGWRPSVLPASRPVALDSRMERA